MERRVLLAIVLSLATVVGFQALTGQCSPKPPPKPTPAAPGDGPPGVPGPGPAAPAPGGPVPAPAPGPEPIAVDLGPQKDVPETRVERKVGPLTLGFTSRGAAIEYAFYAGAQEPVASGPLALLVPADPLHLTGQIDDTVLTPTAAVLDGNRRDPPAGPLRTLSWTRNEAAEASSPEDDLVYVFRTTDGRTFTKQWIFPADPEALDVRLRLQVRGAAAGAPQQVKLLVGGGFLPEQLQGSAMSLPADSMVRRRNERDVTEGFPFGFEPIQFKHGGLDGDPLELLAVRSQYFMVALFPTSKAAPLPAVRAWATGEDEKAREAMQSALIAFYKQRYGRDAALTSDDALKRRLLHGRDHTIHAWTVLDLPTGPESTAVEASFYLGPVARETLRRDGYEPLASVITYPGAFDWLANFLLWIYDRWRLLFGSVGLAVILMTLTVRGGLMPISIRNQLGMRRYGRRVSAVKPHVQALQKRYASNPQKLREETMKLYKEHGIGFPTGCLMMLLQIPIFFALFSSLRVEYTLRGAEFLWIRDLSGPDRLVDLPPATPLISAINLLPILMIVLSVLHTKQMPKPTDEQSAQQMRMMKWMPILFAVILYNYTAALSLYMVISSAIALIEARIVKRRDAADLAARA